MSPASDPLINAVSLFAALEIGDLVKAIVPIVALIIWVISQAMGAVKKEPPAPQRRPPRERPRQAGQQAPPQPRRGALQDEIEDFLRRAAERRQGRPAEAPRAAETKPRQTAKPGRSRVDDRSVVLSPVTEEPAVVELVEEHRRPGSSVSGRHLSTSQFDQRASHMTKLDQADEEMDRHLKQSFDHKLGTLAPSATAPIPAPLTDTTVTITAETVAQTPVAAAGLAAMLANAQSLRQAVILNEIMQRPQERWD